MSYVIGIGLDLVEIGGLSEALRRTPALGLRLFLPSELDRSVESMAGRFAAKEALAKALGGGDLPWTDVEVDSSASGAPRLLLGGAVAARARALGVSAIHLTITHDCGYAAAVVLLQGGKESASPNTASASPADTIDADVDERRIGQPTRHERKVRDV